MSSTLDPSNYFTDPKLVAFVNDVQHGNVAGVQAALAAKVNVNAEGSQGFRPIFFAFIPKDTAVLKILLAAGAKTDVRLTNHSTPLHTAVQLPTPEYTAVLLAARADPNAKGENDKPVLRDALNSEVPATLRLLAKAGADINVLWGGKTPLMAALITFEWTMATTLLELGADVEFKDKSGRGAVDVFCQQVGRIPTTPKNKTEIPPLAKAFADRGVHLPCAAEVVKFR